MKFLFAIRKNRHSFHGTRETHISVKKRTWFLVSKKKRRDTGCIMHMRIRCFPLTRHDESMNSSFTRGVSCVTVQVPECFKHPLHLFPVHMCTRVSHTSVCVCLRRRYQRCAYVRACERLLRATPTHRTPPRETSLHQAPVRVVCRRPNKGTLTPRKEFSPREITARKTKVGCRWINLNNLFTIIWHSVASPFCILIYSTFFLPLFLFRLRC